MPDYLAIALVLFALGLLCLLAEVLLPTGGILVVVSLLFFAFGVGTILYYGTAAEAVVALSGLAVGLPAAGAVAVYAYRRMSIGSPLDDGETDHSVVAQLPQLAELDALKGRTGKTVSTLRPSGVVEFDNRRVDAMTEGMLLDAGVWVRCVDVKGGKVIVRRLEHGADVSDIQPDAGVPPPAAPPPPPGPPDRRRDLDDFDLDLGK
jgi:membrane-bound serine protease (ClpP class)